MDGKAVIGEPPCYGQNPQPQIAVIPAKAGIHFDFSSDGGGQRPRCCAASGSRIQRIYFRFCVRFRPSPSGQSRLHEGAKRRRRKWIPAFAGMTTVWTASTHAGGICRGPLMGLLKKSLSREGSRFCRGGPLCPPGVYVQPHDVGQAQGPVPTPRFERGIQ